VVGVPETQKQWRMLLYCTLCRQNGDFHVVSYAMLCLLCCLQHSCVYVKRGSGQFDHHKAQQDLDIIARNQIPVSQFFHLSNFCSVQWCANNDILCTSRVSSQNLDRLHSASLTMLSLGCKMLQWRQSHNNNHFSAICRLNYQLSISLRHVGLSHILCHNLLLKGGKLL